MKSSGSVGPLGFFDTLRAGLLGLVSVSMLLIGGCAAPPVHDPFPPPKTVQVPMLEGHIQIDGRLTEGMWSRAARLTPFVQYDTQAPARVRTDVRVWYDSAALYLGWVCDDPDIQATFKARDSKFWEEEVVEFFVAPGPLESYYELQWNPLSGAFDALIKNQLDQEGRSVKFDGDWSYTASGMTWAVEVDGSVQDSKDRDVRWTVEVRIPFADFKQGTPRPREIWRGNFYRYNRDTGHEPELLSWSPTIWPGFHQPKRFGYLEFKGK
jgi:hypothetical protein